MNKTNNKVKNKGITLIALIITIIILLILAGVAIATLTGDDGLFKRAKDASEVSKEAELEEMIKKDILEYQIENESGNITINQLKKILDKYFEEVPKTEDELAEKLKDENYSLQAKEEYGKELKLKVSDIYKGKLEDTRPDAEKNISYVGYYADFQNDNGEPTPDGKIDGIIYADLAVGGESQWNNNSDSQYKYDKSTDELKNYKIGEQKTVTEFNNYTKEVISPAVGTSGTDRFYVMALENLDESSHYWYYNASGNLDNTESSSEKINFKDSNGKKNTEEMIKKWNLNGEEGSYGSQNNNDLWGVIQNNKKYNLDKWFVPSRAEWSAFGDMLYTSEYLSENVTTSNYEKYGLNGWYWSSWQYGSDTAWGASFGTGCMGGGKVNGNGYVRLSAIF